MLNKSKLIIAAALLAVGSSVMGASIASAQDVTEHGWRPDQSDAAYHQNANYFYEGIGLPQNGG